MVVELVPIRRYWRLGKISYIYYHVFICSLVPWRLVCCHPVFYCIYNWAPHTGQDSEWSRCHVIRYFRTIFQLIWDVRFEFKTKDCQKLFPIWSPSWEILIDNFPPPSPLPLIQVRTALTLEAKEDARRFFDQERVKLLQEIAELKASKRQTDEALSNMIQADKMKAGDLRVEHQQHQEQISKIKWDCERDIRRLVWRIISYTSQDLVWDELIHLLWLFTGGWNQI